jgi:hypothetical protein
MGLFQAWKNPNVKKERTRFFEHQVYLTIYHQVYLSPCSSSWNIHAKLNGSTNDPNQYHLSESYHLVLQYRQQLLISWPGVFIPWIWSQARPSLLKSLEKLFQPQYTWINGVNHHSFFPALLLLSRNNNILTFC